MKYLFILAAVLGVVAVGSANSFAVTDTYMQYGTIKGSSTSLDHPDWIVLNSFQLGVSVPVSSQSSTISGAPKFSEIEVTKVMDKSSPLLMQQLLQGSIQPVTIDLVEPSYASKSPFTYAEYKLTNALLTGYSVSSGGDIPTETLSIEFEKISYTYTPQNPDGTAGTPITVTWNLATNAP